MHVYGGSDGCNSYGYFSSRLCWAGFWFSANMVAGHVMLSASLLDFGGVRRFWERKSSSGLTSGRLNLAIAGWMTLTFMTVHPFKFRFADAEEYFSGLSTNR